MNDLSQKLISEIQEHGAIPFARFMELALYCPELGYYEREAYTVGRRGDFYTNVSVGELFGRLLAMQFAEWQHLTDAGVNSWTLVEAGAHDGQLAADILDWYERQRSDLFPALSYTIVETSASRRRWQQNKLRRFGERVRWVERLDLLDAVHGVILANELLDALPVHRLGWDAASGKWFEWGVTIEGEQFVWVRLPGMVDRGLVKDLPVNDELSAVLPDGYTLEVSPAAESWWSQAAGKLKRGWLLTADYGCPEEEILSPGRMNGTLRAYHRHHVTDEILARPGEQDITAHVNFPAVKQAGVAAGLVTEFCDTQNRFLIPLASRAWTDQGRFGPWRPQDATQFQTLTHPDHLGRAFQILIQSRLS